MFDSIWQLLLGSYCLLCREAVKGDEGARQLCRWCLASLPWQPAPEQPSPPPGISRCFAPLAYDGAVKRWVLDSKHDAGLIAARTLGVLLADSLQEAYPFPSERPELLLPIPLSGGRLRARGHNQAVLIAAQVARRLGIPLARHCVRRVRHTRVLADLDPLERRLQVARAFTVAGLHEGARVAIIDDVVTTGATAAAVAACLTAAGAGDVQLWAASTAPHRG
jgi:ComF family protein